MSAQSAAGPATSKRLIREHESSARDVLSILFRHKLLICSVFIIVFSVATIVTLLTPKVYESNAQILLRVGRENISLDPTVEGGKTLGMFQEKDKETKSEVAILNSMVLAERVTEKYGPQFILGCAKQIGSQSAPVSPGKTRKKEGELTATNNKEFVTAAHALRAGLSVAHQKETNIIDLAYQSSEPQCAQLFLNELLDAYYERHIEVNRMLATPNFFQEQADRLYTQLASKEDELEAFRTKNNIVYIDEQKKSLIRQVEYLQNQLDNITGYVLSSEAKIAAYERNLKFQNPQVELWRTTGHPNYVAKDIKDQLTKLRLSESDISGRFQDSYRPLIELRKQINYLESLLLKEEDTQTQITSGINEVHQTVENNLEQERATHKYLLAQQEAVAYEVLQRQQELKSISDKELYLARLERDVKMLETEYLSYRDNLQQAKISTALDIGKVSNVRIVQPATLPTSHIKPKRTVNIAVGLLLGLFIGIGLAFIIEFFDDTMKTTEDVEKRLGLPVLAYVSKKEFESCT